MPYRCQKNRGYHTADIRRKEGPANEHTKKTSAQYTSFCKPPETFQKTQAAAVHKMHAQHICIYTDTGSRFQTAVPKIQAAVLCPNSAAAVS